MLEKIDKIQELLNVPNVDASTETAISNMKILNLLVDLRVEAEQLILYSVVATLPQDPIVLARYMHDAYEMLAKNNDWNTQENCKVDFSDLPIGNKNTMILLAGKLILDFGGN